MPDPNDVDFPDPDDRPRGILTYEDRLFLRGDKDLSDQAKRDTRYRIRERVKNGIRDFEPLYFDMPPEDRQKIFTDLHDEPHHQFIYALAYLYLGIKDTDTEFSTVLKSAIKEAELPDNRDKIIDVDVDIDITTREPDVETVIDRLVEGQGTVDDFNYAISKGGIIPVLEHYLDVDQELQLEVEEGQGSEPMKFQPERLEEMRDLYENRRSADEDARNDQGNDNSA